ncbi:MAG TPA: FAD-dependent oxidoreductase, partial [Nitrospirota bacterium]|nr:FAD-dependent oxidoreductase [Nitrospirota bacterium]
KISGKYMEAGSKYIDANWKGARQFKIEIEQMTGKGRTIIPCKNACPAGVNVPGYIALIKAGREKDAYNLIRKENPFPAVCGRVCVHLCESKCVRGEVDQAIAIRHLKRYAADRSLAEAAYDDASVRSNGKTVGIIGAGPSGLTCGYYLARLGYGVDIYEAQSVAGGILAYGIPDFRLPKEVLKREIRLIERAGVKIHLNAKIGKDITLNNLKQKHDAVYVAVGSQFSKRLGIPGEELAGVYNGLDFLRDVNLKKNTVIGKDVVVIGGGNVAFDVARVALRLGAGKVHLACLESREAMLANPEEIKEAEEEGIVIHPSQTFKRIIGKNGKVTGIECLDVESCHFDEEKRPHIKVCEGSEHLLPADTVFFAIGQRPESIDAFELTAGRDNTIQIDRENCLTNQECVFAGGDVARGSDSAIAAIADGKTAAAAIDKYLGGSGVLNKGADIPIPEPEKIDQIVLQSRFPMGCLEPEARKDVFDEIHMGFDEANAMSESKRCLECDR